MKYALTCFVVLLLTVLLGCNKNYPLSGTVTFSDDGSPVPNGIVSFESKGFHSQGRISSDGTYVVGTMKQNDGIPPGTYNVTVGGAVAPIRTEGPPTAPVFLIDAKYELPETSGLTFTADGKTKKFDIVVDRR